jgi:glutamyl-tRNA synthetase
MVRTRIAPSPTGEDLHIGNVYTALINFAWAKKNNGKFILRVEDTDQERLVSGSQERIISSLKWIGLNFDEGPDVGGPYGPYKQSERLDIYKKYAEELINNGHAFYCFCSQERLTTMRSVQTASHIPTLYDGFCKKYSLEESKEKAKTESYVIRLNTPDEGVTKFNDLIRGEITFENKLIDDQVLLKSDGFPTYHLGVVVDDHLMEITHIIRAEEWISSTPKHVLLYDFFGWDLPVFAHTSILRNTDKSKLSKRKNPVWVSWYKKEGFLPEAILNFLSLMGWSHPEEKEEFSLVEFISLFELKDLKAVGPVFDVTKLEWLNGVYIRNKGLEEIKNLLKEFYVDDPRVLEVFKSNHADLVIGLAQTRMKKLSDFKTLIQAPESVREYTSEEKKYAKDLFDYLSKIEAIDWREDRLLDALKNFNKENQTNMKLLYFLITGREQGLPLIETMVKIEGREEILKRLKNL